MATSTGKKARKRYGNRFAAKQRRDAGTGVKRTRKSRKRFGALPFSVSAKNAPEGAVRANEELTYRVARERAANGWELDSNVSVPGPTRESVEARQREEAKALKARRRQDELARRKSLRDRLDAEAEVESDAPWAEREE